MNTSDKESNNQPDKESNTESNIKSNKVSNTESNKVSNTESNKVSNTESNTKSNTESNKVSNTESDTESNKPPSNHIDYAYRSDVDNQLGTLYCCYRADSTQQYKFIPNIPAIELVITNGICVIKNFIEESFAQKARKFASLISFDEKIPRLNNNENQPRSSVFLSLKDKYTISSLDKYKNSIYDEKKSFMKDLEQWTYENYRYGIFRAVPLTPESFINSPIYDMINTVLWKLYKSIQLSFNEDLLIGTVVLQRTPFNTCIGRHIDDLSPRRISFIYYLVPDDWSDSDGGELIIDNRKIIPKFNQLVLWKLNTDKTHDTEPLYHQVERVKTDRPRIALVGFFEQRK
jgi:hypothetical protein